MDLNLSATDKTEVIQIWVVKVHLLRFPMVCLRANLDHVEFAGKIHVNISWLFNPLVNKNILAHKWRRQLLAHLNKILYKNTLTT